MFDADRIYALDIETDTTINGLDPRVAHITEISLTTAAEDIVLVVDGAEQELEALAELDAILQQLPPGLISTWGGTFFDLPFIDTRQRIGAGAESRSPLGLHLTPAPGLVPKYQFLPGHETGYSASWRLPDGERHTHLDIMFGFKRYAESNGIRWGLKPVATSRGIDMIEVDREKMHLLTPAERKAYAASDTRGTRDLTLDLLGLAAPHVPLAA